MQHGYDIDVDNKCGERAGSIFGYTTDTAEEHLKNFLDKHGYHDFDVSEYVDKKIGVLVSLFVEEEKRNQGYGNELMNMVIKELLNDAVEYVFLVADGEEDNAIDLKEWYEGFGFEIIAVRDCYPLMRWAVNG